MYLTPLFLGLPTVCVVAFVALPLLAIVLKVLPQEHLWATISAPLVTEALRLSLLTSLSSLVIAIVCGTPVAYLLARYRFRGLRLVETLIDLPMVLPPTVAGVALLMAFGRRGLIGPWLQAVGLQLSFSTTAVVLAQCFVCLPFYIRAAQAGFRSVDPELERVAHTLGVSVWRTFFRVTVPLAFPALLSGSVMAWARALGEFGATMMFAGNLRGRTQTMPLAIYLALESDLLAAMVLAALLILVSCSVLLCLRALVRRGEPAAYA
ncbi:MAG: molybdate ABC transporter permease subunit [Candidatus Tectomicrobia bacterium]|uniref:Molybdenum transport system permease n=1 Tax=Tectimicrobiota bacterium TaxID=2528274 RepID=A0A937VZB9_UNCTE|nr:molybdate ABC transporter permease subunit [Candidatus Tectomicrobia bacterium]